MLCEMYRRSIYRLVAACVISLFAVGAQAQNYYIDNERTFFGGLVGGVNFAQVSGDNYRGFDKIGMNVGGKVYLPLTSEIVASIEILYTQKGSVGKEATIAGIMKGVSVSNYSISLDYAEVPVMINYFFPGKTHIGVGLSYGRLVRSSEKGITVPDQNFDPAKYPFSKSAIDFILDGNIRVYKGLFINPRFQYSMIKLRNEKNIAPYFYGSSQFSMVFGFRVAYFFGV
ncbi:MAG TPA: outer membrane beta-barrel protein [Flavipsychrobacter sp.]